MRLTNINSGYTLDTSTLPAGASVSGYTGSRSETLTVTVPASAAGQSFSISAEGKDTRSVDNITAYIPANGSLQKIFLCATTAQVVATASFNVGVPAYGKVQVVKTGEDNTALLQLYPSANILVATKKDFETRNRKKFCSRIATGDYDAVIIGHSQFEKIPMSVERQRAILQAQLDEIIEGISEAKRANAERFTIKQMEKSKRSIKLKLDKLNDQTRKDDVVTFEELGVDRLFVDEAHSFKNLFLYTKMRNVAGLAQTEAQKSSDLFMKCRYMDELTDNHGIIFATGTPISNSMTEMYTMQRYLQYDTLRSQGLQHFDAWASTFGETITAIELAPEGTGYRAKTRFARFYNLPELISMFKQVADVQTADMLKLPVPEAEYHNEVIKPSKFQTDMVASFSERAEKVRNGMVDATVDNQHYQIR